MKNQFIDVAAHELRTPVQPIISLSEVLQSTINDTKQQELLDVIVRNAKRLQRLTEDILDVTNIESHSLNLKKERFNLTELISNIVQDATRPVEKKVNNGKLELVFYNHDTDKQSNIIVYADKAMITSAVKSIKQCY